MSTASTAVATLPHYHPRHYQSPYSHSPAASSTTTGTTATTSNNTNYRTNAISSILSPTAPSVSSATSARFPPVYHHHLPANAASSPTDGVTQSSVPPRPPPHVYFEPTNRNLAHPIAHHPSRSYDSNMSSATVTATAHGQGHGLDSSQSHSRKRRRSREPDWQDFYRNGLPSEVIVIDDTPEPEANTGRELINGRHIPGSSHTMAAASSRQSQQLQSQPAKRRRRDPSPNYHIQYLLSSSHLPSVSGASTLSSDRHTSGVATTAPTSLSSNGHYDESGPLKRKRTRQQVADEAKRRDIEGLGDSLTTYIPPPYPPKKAGDVSVRVVNDVSLFLMVAAD